MKRFDLTNMPIARKLSLILMIVILGSIAMFANNILDYRSTLLEARKTELQHVTEGANTILDHYAQFAETDKMTKADARTAALGVLNTYRYSKEGYFWVQDEHPRMVMHPIKPSLIGKDLTNVKDETGKQLFVSFIKEIRNTENVSAVAGFDSYLWPHPGKDKAVEKLSYIRKNAYWGFIIGTGVYIDDINEAVLAKSIEFAILTLITLAVLVGIIRLISKNITKAVQTLTLDTDTLAKGKINHPISSTDRGDEIGSMARALQIFQTNLKDAHKREKKAQEEAEISRKETLNELANTLEAEVVGIIENVANAADGMRLTAGSMSQAADVTSEQTAIVAAASTQASQNVQNVAAASEQLYNSITEISRQVAQSSDITRQATAQIENTSEKVNALNDAATQISTVVELITDIADQTNLLALNATIEAARAGDAGKGFAVVANEVKNLANQTARATGEISDQIGKIQSETRATVSAIQEITEVIRNLDSIASSIASAVEEQGAATQEIARNVQEASDGTDEVNRSITSVTTVAQETGQSAGSVVTASEEVSQQAEDLRTVVQQFLNSIRTA